MLYQKKLNDFQKNKIFVTITFELSIVKNFQFSQNEQTIANQIISTIFLILLNKLQTINQIISIIKNINISNKTNNDLKLDSIYVISNINFQFIDNLIYYCKNKNNRLCIFNNCVQNILQMIYNDCVHVEHYRTYVKFVDLIYIKIFLNN